MSEAMNKIQEVVHKFRSGGMEKREGSGAGGRGGGGGETQRVAATHSSGLVHTISSGSLPGEGAGQTKWYVDPPFHTADSPMTDKSELSTLPIMTPSGLQQTMLAALGRSDPVHISNRINDSAPSSLPPSSPEKKMVKTRPKGTLEYKVVGSDTLERIAARFDVTPSEVKKLNRMSSRMVFENQVLYIPDPDYVPSDPPTPEPASPVQSPLDVRPKLDLPIVKMADRPPARVPGHVMKIPSPPSSAPPVRTAPAPILPRALSEDEARKLDEECYERFIKVSAQLISEGFDRVAGTLLVTPNAIMFDPDVLDQRVVKEGVEAFGVVVYMDTVVSAALYHDLSPFTFRTDGSLPRKVSGKAEVYHGDMGRRLPPSSSDPLAAKSQSPSSGDSILNGHNVSGLSPIDASGTDKGGVDSGGSTQGGETSLISGGSETDGEEAIQFVGDFSQPRLSGKIDLIDSAPGETSTEDSDFSLMTFDLDSLASGLKAAPSTVGATVSQENTQQGDELLPFTDWPTDLQGKHDTDTNIDLQDEVDIQALLAGGRRDSLAAEKEGVKVSNVFYPTSPEEVTVDGQEVSKDVDETLVKECADKLVADILQSVSWSSGLNTAAGLSTEDGDGVVQKQPEMSMMETDIKVKDEKEKDEGMGEEEKDSSSTVNLLGDDHLKDQGDDQLKDQPATNTSNVIDAASSTDNTTDPAASSTKRKPAPLTNIGMDTTDGSMVGEGVRSRPESESFSPLRSSVQHLTNFVDYATGLFRSGSSDERPLARSFDIPVVRDRSSVPTEPSSDVGKEKEGGGTETEKSPIVRVESAVKIEERPELFRQVSDLIPQTEDVHSQPAIYLHLNVDTVECDRRVTTSTPSESYRHQHTRPHYWFSFPRHKADHLYAFFVQWRPEVYGDDDFHPEKLGFVVVNEADVEEAAGGLSFVDDYFGPRSSAFKKDWEIISREEAIRRGSLVVDHSNMPELSHQSSILSEQHILQLSDHLPPRTIGYKWSLAYSTSLHGFSLKRLYREVGRLDSPILLVLQDTEDTVFGAFLSDPPKLSDHFFGTGMCQLWTFKDKFRSFCWTGDNAFFIKGDENSMSVGASQGVYGLWLDSDLYHGRSRQCTTFNNIVLSANEDFCISALEAWAFVSD